MINFPYQLIDLTHTLDETIPSWTMKCGFNHEIKLDYTDCSAAVKFRVQQIKMHAGIGTHIDAPAHCIPNAMTVEQIPLTDLIAPCVMIDVSHRADENYQVSVQDVKQFEKMHGEIPVKHFVMIRTGWERFWKKPEKYHNNYIFPSISLETALFLLERKIVGLGIDTLSPDRPDEGHLVHNAILGSGKYIIENVANLALLPSVQSYILALPIKTRGGTEAPLRLVGLIRQNETLNAKLD